jgi:hypothetical protein
MLFRVASRSAASPQGCSVGRIAGAGLASGGVSLGKAVLWQVAL